MSVLRAQLPRVFIGSSTESLEIAETIQELLDYETEPTVWSQGVFRPSSFALVDLVQASRSFDFAIFAFAPDDVLVMRGKTAPSVRDNVVFELGLFIGALEPTRCFIVVPRDCESLHLPTDLLGIAPVTYRSDRGDRRLQASLGPACLQVRRAIRDLHGAGREEQKSSPAVPGSANDRVDQTFLSAQDFIAEWRSPDLQAARAEIREIPLDHYRDDFQKMRPSLKRVFLFLEELARVILEGLPGESKLKVVFEEPVRILWPHFYVMLAPPNQADEWWEAKPARLRDLYARWIKHV
jgi:hypothetical protein